MIYFVKFSLGTRGNLLYSEYMESDSRLKAKVTAYSPSSEALVPIHLAPMLFLVGITGAGKNTILTELLKQYPNRYRFIISHTTRAPRENQGVMEQDGREYHFVNAAKIEQMIDDGELIEVQPIHAHISGSSIEEVLHAYQQHKIAVSDIDVQGADYCVGLGLNIKPIFILPPSYDVWYERFVARYKGNVHKHDLVIRMQSAVKEIQHALDEDYYYIVINDDLQETVALVDDIAQDGDVPTHYHKAVAIAQTLLDRIREELSHLL
jgi:guanylate kinase